MTLNGRWSGSGEVMGTGQKKEDEARGAANFVLYGKLRFIGYVGMESGYALI